MWKVGKNTVGVSFVRGLAAVGISSLLLVVIASISVNAMTFSSSNYIIDTAVLNNVGGSSSSTNYQLVSSGGEAVIGEGASGSYKLAAGYVAQLSSSPTITVTTQPSGLIGGYSLDEGNGTTAYDYSSYENDGSLNGGPTWGAGKIGSSLSFNGSQTVNIPNEAQLQTTPITIESWVNTSTSQNAAIVGKNNAWALNITTSGAAIYDYTAGSNTCTTSTGITTGSWHHVAATIESGVTNGTKLYIDGIQRATCTVTIVNQSSTVSIAGVSGTGQYTGLVDEVKLFERALSYEEITADYTAQDNGVLSGLTLQTIIPGVSNEADFTVIIDTNGSSYTVALNQNHDLQFGANTILPISGSIATPASWTEGTTKGFGFTLMDTNATAIDPKWNSGVSYAALPNTATTVYTRTGVPSTKDTLDMQLRADTPSSQPSGAYSNTMYISGTVSP